MNNEDKVQATFWNESTGHCACCGKQSRTIWEIWQTRRERRLSTLSSGPSAIQGICRISTWSLALGETELRQPTACWCPCYTSRVQVAGRSWWLTPKEGELMTAACAAGHLSGWTLSEPR